MRSTWKLPRSRPMTQHTGAVPYLSWSSLPRVMMSTLVLCKRSQGKLLLNRCTKQNLAHGILAVLPNQDQG
jgi:hypothetical protein